MGFWCGKMSGINLLHADPEESASLIWIRRDTEKQKPQNNGIWTPLILINPMLFKEEERKKNKIQTGNIKKRKAGCNFWKESLQIIHADKRWRVRGKSWGFIEKPFLCSNRKLRIMVCVMLQLCQERLIPVNKQVVQEGILQKKKKRKKEPHARRGKPDDKAKLLQEKSRWFTSNQWCVVSQKEPPVLKREAWASPQP